MQKIFGELQKGEPDEISLTEVPLGDFNPFDSGESRLLAGVEPPAQHIRARNVDREALLGQPEVEMSGRPPRGCQSLSVRSAIVLDRSRSLDVEK